MATNRIHDEFVKDIPVSPVFVYIATAIGMPAIILGHIVEGTYRWMKSRGNVVKRESSQTISSGLKFAVTGNIANVFGELNPRQYSMYRRLGMKRLSTTSWCATRAQITSG